MFDYCSECNCGKKNPIVNKTRYLCEKKNRERLDKNKVPKKKESLEKVRKELASKPIRAISNRRVKEQIEYKRVCNEISEERGHRCESCGTTEFLSYSHLLPRSSYRKLITVKKNIKIQCMSFGDHLGCHDEYEAGRIEGFIDKEEILEIVKELDIQFFKIKFGQYDRT